MLAAGFCRVASARRSQGLPCARHSRFQPGAVDSLQDAVEPMSQAGGASGKKYFSNSDTLGQQRSKKAKKSVRNNSVNMQVREERGESSPGCQNKDSSAGHG